MWVLLLLFAFAQIGCSKDAVGPEAVEVGLSVASADHNSAQGIFVPRTDRAGLAAAVAAANDGETLLLEGGKWKLKDPGIVQIFAENLTIKSADPNNPAHLVGRVTRGAPEFSFFNNTLFVVDHRVETGPHLKNLNAEGFRSFAWFDPSFTISPPYQYDCNPGGSLTGATVTDCKVSKCWSGVAAFGEIHGLDVSDNSFLRVGRAVVVFGGSFGVGCGVVTPRATDVHVRDNICVASRTFGTDIGLALLVGVDFMVEDNTVTGFPYGMIIGESHPASYTNDDDNGDGVIDDLDALGANPNWGEVRDNVVTDCSFAGILPEAATPPFEGGGPIAIIDAALVTENQVSNSASGIFLGAFANGFLVEDNTVFRSGDDCSLFFPQADYVLQPTVFGNTLFVSSTATVCDKSGGANEIIVDGMVAALEATAKAKKSTRPSPNANSKFERQSWPIRLSPLGNKLLEK
jgi:hypothetical protein